MTVDEANLASELLLSHLRHWQGLRQMSMNANVKRWRFRPKHHYIEHVALSLPRVRLNPQKTANFNIGEGPRRHKIALNKSRAVHCCGPGGVCGALTAGGTH